MGRNKDKIILVLLVLLLILIFTVSSMSTSEKHELRDKVKEMFHHAYRNYMKHAYPADELMPLSCKGRYRGSEPNRGDIDDALGNFSLTLVDTLDTLVVLGELDEFDKAVRYVIRDVQFDNDIVVSLFETNIRMLGGLLGGHVLASYLKRRGKAMGWYQGELLTKAKDLGYRLLPAFNTTTGIPFPRVNLMHGVDKTVARTGHEKDTCTACAGTMILEFAALSRLSGEPIFEEKARKAMEFLWQQRHRGSGLVGTVINIHSGDWIRRESGVGAGVDSYYEYLFKAYILLGDETYLDRFNKHYESIDKYVKQGPLLVDVHMHKPFTNSRNFMDALLAFWPGLQVLKGDIKPAIETHEMLYQVHQRHNFLPEAFTTDFRVHWGQHPLRPEFTESTYFIYKATGDPYYLKVGKTVMESLEKHARVDCGYASIKDVTTGAREDQMDSFVLAETFKYLYLLFADKEDHVIDVDDFIFTTEAHLLPLSLSLFSPNFTNTSKDESPAPSYREDDDDDNEFDRSCPNSAYLFPGSEDYAHSVRTPLKDYVEKSCPKPKQGYTGRPTRLRAADFIAGNKQQMAQLKRMGIQLITMRDGRVQLLHTASEAASVEDAEDGMLFMQDMIELSKVQQQDVQQEPRVIQLVSPPFFGQVKLNAGHAQFGLDLKTVDGVMGKVVAAQPIKGCQPLENVDEIRGNIAVLERGECMFIDKARHAQAAEAIGAIVIDHTEGTSSQNSPLFAMSGDGKNDVSIPLVFLFHEEGKKLSEYMLERPNLEINMGYKAKQSEQIMRDLMDRRRRQRLGEDGDVVHKARMDQSEEATDKTDKQESSSSSDGKEDEIDPLFKEDDLTEEEVIKLFNKYIDRVGGQKIQTSDQYPSASEDLKAREAEGSNKDTAAEDKDTDRVLQIVDGPGGSKQVRIDFDKLFDPSIDRKVSQVFNELMILLQTHTNFEKLGDQHDYTRAIGKLVEAALSDGLKSFDQSVSKQLDKLTRELQPKLAEQEGFDEVYHYTIHGRENQDKSQSVTFDPSGEVSDASSGIPSDSKQDSSSSITDAQSTSHSDKREGKSEGEGDVSTKEGSKGTSLDPEEWVSTDQPTIDLVPHDRGQPSTSDVDPRPSLQLPSNNHDRDLTHDKEPDAHKQTASHQTDASAKIDYASASSNLAAQQRLLQKEEEEEDVAMETRSGAVGAVLSKDSDQEHREKEASAGSHARTSDSVHSSSFSQPNKVQLSGTGAAEEDEVPSAGSSSQDRSAKGKDEL